MSDEITPALTPDEWRTRAMASEYVIVSQFQRVDGRGVVIGARPWLNAEQRLGEAVSYQLDGDGAKKVAALCLIDQPFGFTQEDVNALRESAEDDQSAYDHHARLRSIADRIAALLPPPQPHV